MNTKNGTRAVKNNQKQGDPAVDKRIAWTILEIQDVQRRAERQEEHHPQGQEIQLRVVIDALMSFIVLVKMLEKLERLANGIQHTHEKREQIRQTSIDRAFYTTACVEEQQERAYVVGEEEHRVEVIERNAELWGVS